MGGLERGMWAAAELIRPVVFIKFRRIIFRVAVLNSDPTGQDGGHIIAHHITLLLLPLLFNPSQLKALADGRKQVTARVTHSRQ